MTKGRDRDAPRSPRVNGTPPRRRTGPLWLALAVFCGVLGGVGPGSGSLAAQTPADTLPPDAPRPDTVPADTLLPDTVAGDTLPADSMAAADTVPLERLPTLRPAVPEGWERGVWEWDREDLLGSRARTLAELLTQVPGVVGLRGGDFGMPQAASAFGLGGGGLRVFRDGVELIPLEGSVPDLSRVALTGVESVRVERTPAGLRVELRSLRARDRRPYSRIEAGTGDLDTNLLRGVFFHPRAFGGNAGLSLDRIDTRGPGLQEPGAVTSVWLHYAYLRERDLGLTFDFHRSTSNRDTLFVPGEMTRTDLKLGGRWEPLDGLVAEAFWGSASLESDSVGAARAPFLLEDLTRRQWGARLGAELGPLSGRATYRNLSGSGLPDEEVDVELAGRMPGAGGLGLSWERRSWPGHPTSTLGLRGWTTPRWGLSFFGSIHDFEVGAPALPPRRPPFLPAEPRFVEGTSTRAGARFAWRGLELSGARLGLERDSVHPLGLPFDRGGPSFGAGERTGWEASVRLPVPPIDGLALVGSGQLWERTEEPRPYDPRRNWQAALTLNETYFPSEDLELWLDVGVEGRDRMAVALARDRDAETGSPAPATVPAYRLWYARLQIRVVTVRIFATWDNVTLRDRNQDFPGRVLPRTRFLWGVRWTLWN